MYHRFNCVHGMVHNRKRRPPLCEWCGQCHTHCDQQSQRLATPRSCEQCGGAMPESNMSEPAVKSTCQWIKRNLGSVHTSATLDKLLCGNTCRCPTRGPLVSVTRTAVAKTFATKPRWLLFTSWKIHHRQKHMDNLSIAFQNIKHNLFDF